MSTINVDAKEISIKVVYYGAGLCGKTTSLASVHRGIPKEKRAKMVSLATEEDRTLFFDFLPVVASKVGPYTVRLQLYTVPGQVFYNSTRKLVLQGADGVVFVADSQPQMRDANLESLGNLKENLAEWGAKLDKIPHILQLNKRDLPGVMSTEQMTKDLNPYGAPVFETVASTGEGVFDALRQVVKLVVMDISKAGFKDQHTLSRAAPPPPRPKLAEAVPAPVMRSTSKAFRVEVPGQSAERTVSGTPGATGDVSFAACWRQTEFRLEVRGIEQLIGVERYADAVVKCDQLVGLAATTAGYSGDNRPIFVLIHGVSGEQYRRFRSCVTRALRTERVTKVDALFAVHFATQFAFVG